MTTHYKEGDKLYIVTREDIDPGYQAVQSIHAMRQFVADHPEIDRQWFTESNYIALLSVKNENELINLLERATPKIKCSLFREPDIGNQITAIVLEPGKLSEKLCKRLNLALK